MLELGVKVLISYLAGSLNGALIVGKLSGGIDIRRLGSGNAGGTNALRTQGKWFAFRVMVIDVAKGFLPVWWLPALALPGVPADPDVTRAWLMVACASGAILGHCYPVWFEFKGGKGAATAVGSLLAIDPALALPAVAIWTLVLVSTGFVGLATMLAAAVLPVWVGFTRLPADPELFWFLVALAGFIAYTHRENIRRLRTGTEERLKKAMVLRRRRE